MLKSLLTPELNSSIRTRMIVYLSILGMLSAFILSTIEAYLAYQWDIENVHVQFDQLEDSFIEGISGSVWSLDTNLTQIQLDGIKALPNIIYARIDIDDEPYSESGDPTKLTDFDNLFFENYQLIYNYGTETQVLGMLVVVADISTIRQTALTRLGSILFFNVLSITALIVFVAILMNLMILQHVIKISRFMREIAQDSLQYPITPLALDRPLRSEQRLDELDRLVNAFNYQQNMRTQSNQALLSSEEKFSKAFQASPHLFIITRQSDGALIEINEAFTRICGWTRTEAIGKTAVQLKLWTTQYRDELTDSMANGITNNLELKFLTKSGQPRLGQMAYDIITINQIPCFIIIVNDITQRKLDEQEILESRERLRYLANRLEEVREEERSGIARELHDELGQALTGFKIDLTRLSDIIPFEDETEQRISLMVHNIDTTIDVVRRMSSELRPPVLDDLGLAAAIEWLTTGFSERTGIAYELDLDCDSLIMNKAWDTAIFRIYQESLVNIARHSGAKMFKATVKIVNNALHVHIQDNGIGITLEQIEHSTSIGLLGMQERAAHIGATITISNIDAGGTDVLLIAPLSN